MTATYCFFGLRLKVFRGDRPSLWLSSDAEGWEMGLMLWPRSFRPVWIEEEGLAAAEWAFFHFSAID